MNNEHDIPVNKSTAIVVSKAPKASVTKRMIRDKEEWSKVISEQEAENIAYILSALEIVTVETLKSCVICMAMGWESPHWKKCNGGGIFLVAKANLPNSQAKFLAVPNFYRENNNGELRNLARHHIDQFLMNGPEDIIIAHGRKIIDYLKKPKAVTESCDIFSIVSRSTAIQKKVVSDLLYYSILESRNGIAIIIKDLLNVAMEKYLTKHP